MIPPVGTTARLPYVIPTRLPAYPSFVGLGLPRSITAMPTYVLGTSENSTRREEPTEDDVDVSTAGNSNVYHNPILSQPHVEHVYIDKSAQHTPKQTLSSSILSAYHTPVPHIPRETFVTPQKVLQSEPFKSTSSSTSSLHAPTFQNEEYSDLRHMSNNVHSISSQVLNEQAAKSEPSTSKSVATATVVSTPSTPTPTTYTVTAAAATVPTVEEVPHTPPHSYVRTEEGSQSRHTADDGNRMSLRGRSVVIDNNTQTSLPTSLPDPPIPSLPIYSKQPRQQIPLLSTPPVKETAHAVSHDTHSETIPMSNAVNEKLPRITTITQSSVPTDMTSTVITATPTAVTADSMPTTAITKQSQKPSKVAAPFFERTMTWIKMHKIILVLCGVVLALASYLAYRYIWQAWKGTPGAGTGVESVGENTTKVRDSRLAAAAPTVGTQDMRRALPSTDKTPPIIQPLKTSDESVQSPIESDASTSRKPASSVIDTAMNARDSTVTLAHASLSRSSVPTQVTVDTISTPTVDLSLIKHVHRDSVPTAPIVLPPTTEIQASLPEVPAVRRTSKRSHEPISHSVTESDVVISSPQQRHSDDLNLTTTQTALVSVENEQTMSSDVSAEILEMERQRRKEKKRRKKEKEHERERDKHRERDRDRDRDKKRGSRGSSSSKNGTSHSDHIVTKNATDDQKTDRHTSQTTLPQAERVLVHSARTSSAEKRTSSVRHGDIHDLSNSTGHHETMPQYSLAESIVITKEDE